jgi:hypothetical protein
MEGDILIRNTGPTPIANWKLTFTFSGQIDSIWNGAIQNHAGNQYTVGPASWNSSIPVGGSVDIGFVAHPGGLAATDFVLTSAPASGTNLVVPAVPVPASTSGLPADAFAPYVDASAGLTYDVIAASKSTGFKFETFTPGDAQKPEAWAASHGIGLLNRDQQYLVGAVGCVNSTSSTLIQTKNEFAADYEVFVG